jgi:hypothetical protein
MRRRNSVRAGLVLAVAAVSFALFPISPAWAHEDRVVGKYHLAVGFGEEPVYAGLKNSVQMFLSEAATDKPVVDLGPTLKVEVIYGNQTMPKMTMDPNFEIGEFGTPGDYDAFFFPTRPGNYTFHLIGAIKGQRIDEKFTSSPSTFSSVENPQGVEFPAKDPTTGQLAERMGREFPRIDARLADQQSNLQDGIDSAKLLAIIGVVVGALGLLSAGAALALRRKR